jgi:hypothetical protein
MRKEWSLLRFSINFFKSERYSNLFNLVKEANKTDNIKKNIKKINDIK